MTNEYPEKLFSYGTLRFESVQLANFGRLLIGNEDTLPGFELSKIKIKNTDVIAMSGVDEHPIVSYTGKNTNTVNSIVFNVSKAELEQADKYEVEEYTRINVKLASGVEAWVYVNRDSIILNSLK
ncbi:gamma-glutamylcyclotransferase family protein [Legionella sp. km772]|uniref:gamma-glutamylcyclotransferase family protein n=1 Tax=Legionella sp. km772 TaxID=2498111 RepID=UPI000F8ED456|nr:gamma-glutamylcyclotransferase family protein [Legionella sp. km772]RUR06806.1 gamma-glutamylcyclotransferase [Legionella sp. km772]